MPKNRSGAELLIAGAQRARLVSTLCRTDYESSIHLKTAAVLMLAAERAAQTERQNAATDERAARTGGDGHTYVMDDVLVGECYAVARAYLGEA